MGSLIKTASSWPFDSQAQSTLYPAGKGAELIADLFWWMAGGSLVIWLAVMAIAIYAFRHRPLQSGSRSSRWLILGGGALVPTVVLCALLGYGLWLMPKLRPPVDAGDVAVEVVGEQWWWRVSYQRADQLPVELANEIRLPVGGRVEFTLSSPDVIHSFWIPALGGKMDMIPGRVTRLVLEPTRTGVFRGACAEYCGTSHALMNFAVVVMEQDAFAQWLESQAQPAAAPANALAAQGKAAFLSNGCGACHTVRGTSAKGRVGPDLTHVGSRLTVGAGILPTEPATFARWISHTDEIKPEVKMPSFGMLPANEIRALAAYLSGLQ